MQKIILILSFLIVSKILSAQLITKPNSGQKSHKTLTIDKIDINSSYTIITLTIINKIENGSFCADKNIYIKNSIGTEIYQLIRAENIPACPESHKFRDPDDSLTFKLYFPPISNNIKYLDLVESCNFACFNFKGIILSNTTNNSIEKAFNLYSSSQKEKSAKAFEQIIPITKDYPYAFIYFSVIRIWNELGNYEKVNQLKSELNLSNKIDKNYINYN